MTDRIQLAIDYLRRHPGSRTADLAKAMDMDSGVVQPTLKTAIDRGVIVVCKVEIPGHSRPINEYRISSAHDYPGFKWAEFKASQTKSIKPLKEAPVVRRAPAKLESSIATTPAGGGANNTGSHVSEILSQASPAEGVAVVEPPKPAPKPAEARSDETKKLRATLSLDGHLLIAFRNTGMTLPPEEVRQLGQFLIDTEPHWS